MTVEKDQWRNERGSKPWDAYLVEVEESLQIGFLHSHLTLPIAPPAFLTVWTHFFLTHEHTYASLTVQLVNLIF